MSELDHALERVRKQREAEARAQRLREEWDASFFAEGDVLVGDPSAESASLVNDFLERAPRGGWTKVYVGSGPDRAVRMRTSVKSVMKKGLFGPKYVSPSMQGVRRMSAIGLSHTEGGGKDSSTVFFWILEDGRVAGRHSGDLAREMAQWLTRE